MKTIKSVAAALVSTLFLGSLMFSQGTVNQRERRQQERIADGVKDGELTPKETRKLEKEQAKIHTAEAKAKSSPGSSRLLTRLPSRNNVSAAQID